MQRPTTLSSTHDDDDEQQQQQQRSTESVRRYNIDHITLSPSPIETNVPRVFRPGMLFDTETFQRIETQATNVPLNKTSSDKIDHKEEEDDNDKSTVKSKTLDYVTLRQQTRQHELQELLKIIIRDRPKHDSLADLLIEHITSVNDITIPSHRSSSTTDMQRKDSTIAMTTNTTTMNPVVRVQAGQRRQYEKQIFDQASELAKTSVDQAMDLIRDTFPSKFVEHSSWYLKRFNYAHLCAQQEADRQGVVDKEYIWPHSFPHCTPQLRDTVNQWIQNQFCREKHAKCLILIGPTRTGKTSFALSLPGHVNYFQGRWNLDAWKNYARYSVYDAIPWDDFPKLNYPNKKNLLTQKTELINATDKYRKTRKLNVRQPAIVLLNLEDAGSLLRTPMNETEKEDANFWQKHAIIYVMGPDEYFYRRRPRTRATTTTTSQTTNRSDSDSSDSSNEQHINIDEEFKQMYEDFYAKQSK